MKYVPSVIVVTLALTFCLPVAADPPKKTLESFEFLIKNEDLRGSFLLWAKSSVSKKNGKGNTVEETLMKIVNLEDESDSELISYKKDGKDLTEKRRKEMEKREAEEAKKAEEAGADKDDDDDGDGGSFSLDFGMTLPTEENRDKYEFKVEDDEGGTKVVSFTPVKPDENADKLVSGRLGWNADTLDPVFIETQPIENPKYVEELWMRFEFERAGEKLMMKRNHTKGVGGILLVKRKFDVEIEIRDYEPPPAD